MLNVQTIIALVILNCVNDSYGDIFKDKDIVKLEEEKTKLVKQINEAIDESVKSLMKSNDRDLAKGIEFMTNLKKQIKEINHGDMKIEVSEAGRRAMNQTESRRVPEISVTLEELQKIFKVKSKAPTEAVIKNDDMRNKIDQWVLQKRLEAQKIKDFYNQRKESAMAGAREKCPDFGLGKGNVKGGNGGKRKRVHPCCRKCCKKSYMGCL